MKLTLRTKLYGSFVLVLALLLAVSGLAIVKMGSISDESADLGLHALPKIDAIDEIDACTMDYRGIQYAQIAVTTAAQKQALARRLTDRRKDVEEDLDRFQASATDPADLAGLKGVRTAWLAYLQKTRRLVALSNAGRNAEATALLSQSVSLYDAMQTQIDRWNVDTTKDADATVSSARSTYS